MTVSLPPLLPDATRDLARFAAGLRFEDLPDTVVERAKLCLLDGIGVCLHGAALPWTRILREVVLAEGAAAQATIWGSGAKAPLAQAVLVNGSADHAFEMDDSHKDSVLHPNSIATPIGLGFAEATGAASGRDVLTAVVAGYEVGTRVGNAAHPCRARRAEGHHAPARPLSRRHRQGASRRLAHDLCPHRLGLKAGRHHRRADEHLLRPGDRRAAW